MRSRPWTKDLSSVTVAGSNVVLMILGILTGILSARLLGPDGRGMFLTWQTWAIVAANIANLGFAQAVVTTRLYDVLPPRHQLAVLITLIGANCAVLCTGIFWFLDASWMALLGGFFFAASNSIAAILPAIAQRVGGMVTLYNSLRLIPQMVTAATLMMLFSVHLSDPVAVLSAIGILQFATILVLSVSVVSKHAHGGSPDRGFWLEGVKLGPPGWALFAFAQSDLLVVTLLFTKTEVALYGVAFSVQFAIFAVGQSVAMRWFSQRSDWGNYIPLFIWKQVVVAAGAPALLSAATAAWLVPLAYGEEFSAAVPAAAILTIGGFIRSLDSLLWHHMIGRTNIVSLILKRLTAVLVLAGGAAFVANSLEGYRLEAMALVSVGSASLGLGLLYFGRNGYGKLAIRPELMAGVDTTYPDPTTDGDRTVLG